MLPFGKHRGAGWWPGNARRRQVTVAGVDERSRGMVGLIDRVAGRGMNGHSGHIGAGLGSSPAYKFSGYLAYDTLALTRTVAASTNLVRDPNTALPATAGELVQVAAAGSVMDSLAAIPPGYR